MDLKSGYPYWALCDGLLPPLPPLTSDRTCDVLVVGGGITGTLIADELARHGHDVLLVEQRDIGWGSTAASTALLQYEIDTHMTELARRHGEDAAVLAYRACADALPWLHERIGALGRKVGHRSCSSLYYASRRWHVGRLRREGAMRRRHGIEVDLLDAAGLQTRFGFHAPAALLSRLGARVDPYRLAQQLALQLHRGGSQVADHVEVEYLEPRTRDVQVRLAGGTRIRARHVVMACGYETQRWLARPVARNRSSYAFVTRPLHDAMPAWMTRTLLWETARPYLYIRSTDEGRLLVGGEDDAIDIPARRDRKVMAKAKTLASRANALFPELPLEPDFAWAGTFAETADGLPWFGAHPQWGPRVLFAMAYGGNGITYSAIGAQLLRATIERRRHPLKDLFGFGRKA